MSHRSGCLLCGQELIYHSSSRRYKCRYCANTFSADVACAEAHYVCDTCHSRPALEVITDHCLRSDSSDPLAIAEQLMADRRLNMHGPEHHYLVPAVLLTAYCNRTGETVLKEARLAKARERAARVPGGFCGTHGNCGAGVGAGIAISVLTGATPLSLEEWALANRMTARVLHAEADIGGPRCCKRNTRVAIKESVAFIHEHLEIEMGTEAATIPVCEYVELNRECIEGRCPFFPT